MEYFEEHFGPNFRVMQKVLWETRILQRRALKQLMIPTVITVEPKISSAQNIYKLVLQKYKVPYQNKKNVYATFFLLNKPEILKPQCRHRKKRNFSKNYFKTQISLDQFVK